MGQRLVIVLGAAIVGAIFVAGLFINGRGGGALLVLTDVILIALTVAVWNRLRPQGRPLRILVIAVIAAVAMIKLVHG
jgi:hypothetical protein